MGAFVGWARSQRAFKVDERRSGEVVLTLVEGHGTVFWEEVFKRARDAGYQVKEAHVVRPEYVVFEQAGGASGSGTFGVDLGGGL